MDLRTLYQSRFSGSAAQSKSKIWQVLCVHFFQKWVTPNDCVIDLAAGYCEFINNIQAKRKIAVDLNPDVHKYAGSGVEVVNSSCEYINEISDQVADVVFISNFLEHLSTKESVLQVLNESARLLKSGGRVIVLQPNIRYTGPAYWDFFDHHIPLTEKSLIEALQMAGMEIEYSLPRFLPYTTKGSLPKSSVFVWLYLKVPLVWRVLGQQSLIVAKRPR